MESDAKRKREGEGGGAEDRREWERWRGVERSREEVGVVGMGEEERVSGREG